MKKFLLTILSLTCAFLISTSLLLFKNSKCVSANSFDTEYFLPTHPIEFYDLNSPVSISYSSDDYLIISEYEKKEDPLTHQITEYSRLTMFNPQTKEYSLLLENQNVANINSIVKRGDYIYFLDKSLIYYLPVNNLTSAPVSTGVFSSTFFCFVDDMLIVNTNNSLNTYSLSLESGSPVFTQEQNVFGTITTTSGFYSQTDERLYLLETGGNIRYIEPKNDVKAQFLTNVDKSIISITDIENYLYLTANDGLYRLKKEQNATLEKVLETNSSATTLGNLKSPTGLSKKGDNLLIADSELDCIQEFNPATLKFTEFAITTQSTADFRLTYNADKTCLSENYLYVLDDASIKIDDQEQPKRIVRIELDSQTNRYKKIDLTNLYEQNSNFTIKLFTASDDRVLIYDGNDLILYKIEGEESLTLLEEQRTTLTVTSICYLDGTFYYTNTISPLLNEFSTKITALEIANSANGLYENTTYNLTPHNEVISGKALAISVDIFGNVYVVHSTSNDSQNAMLSKIYGGTIKSSVAINFEVVKIQTDFQGNVYLLAKNGDIYKCSPTFEMNKIDYSPCKDDQIKSLALNYHSQEAYLLGNACIYKTVNNSFQIESLDKISADGIDVYKILNEPKFVSINENAKIFKISFDNIKTNSGGKYFDNISPIKNPNTSKAYLVVAELQEYYLVSYSSKFVALVNKTAGAQIINSQDYGDYDLSITTSNDKKYLSNDVKIFAKPLFDDNYSELSLDRGDEVFTLKTLIFNDVKMTLISLEENGNAVGYIVDSYLCDGKTQSTIEKQETTTIIGENADKKALTAVMILIIALTVTLTALFIEKKLLFKEE